MPLIEDDIDVADVLRRGDGHGRPPRILPVEALILEVREPDDAIPHQVGAAAVLVDSSPRVVLGRRDIRSAPVGTAPDDDIAAGLGGPPFNPIDVIAVELDLREADHAGDDRIGCDRRAPGAIRADLRSSHRDECTAPTLPSPASGGGKLKLRSPYAGRVNCGGSCATSRTSASASSSISAVSRSARRTSSDLHSSTTRSRCTSIPKPRASPSTAG